MVVGAQGRNSPPMPPLPATFDTSVQKIRVSAVATGLVFEVVIIVGGLLGGAIAFLTGARYQPDGADVATHKVVVPGAGSEPRGLSRQIST